MLDVGYWMDVGWLEKAELKPTQPSLAGAWLSLVIPTFITKFCLYIIFYSNLYLHFAVFCDKNDSLLTGVSGVTDCQDILCSEVTDYPVTDLQTGFFLSNNNKYKSRQFV